MNSRNDPQDLSRQDLAVTSQDLAVTRYAIGQPVPRTEDPTLVRGEGRFTDDVSLPGQAYLVMVRSRHAHGLIRAISRAAARKMPGVLGDYTGDQPVQARPGTLEWLAAFKNRDSSEMQKPP